MIIETAVTMDSPTEDRSLAIAGDASSRGDSSSTSIEGATVAVPGPGDDDDDDDEGGDVGNIDPDDDEGYDEEDDDEEEPLQVRRSA